MSEAQSGLLPNESIGRALYHAAWWTALAGGALLVVILAVQLISIVMRGLWGSPIPGDFEIVQVGTPVIIFAFLPYCQMVRANFVVDLVAQRFPPRLAAAGDALGSLLFATVAALLTWRMTVGGFDMRHDGGYTMVLQFPLWTAFIPIVPCLALLTSVTLYLLRQDLRRLLA